MNLSLLIAYPLPNVCPPLKDFGSYIPDSGSTVAGTTALGPHTPITSISAGSQPAQAFCKVGIHMRRPLAQRRLHAVFRAAPHVLVIPPNDRGFDCIFGNLPRSAYRNCIRVTQGGRSLPISNKLRRTERNAAGLLTAHYFAARIVMPPPRLTPRCAINASGLSGRKVDHRGRSRFRFVPPVTAHPPAIQGSERYLTCRSVWDLSGVGSMQLMQRTFRTYLGIIMLLDSVQLLALDMVWNFHGQPRQ